MLSQGWEVVSTEQSGGGNILVIVQDPTTVGNDKVRRPAADST